MDPETERLSDTCTVHDVFVTAQETLREYLNVSRHFVSHADVLSVLLSLNSPLKSVEERLEIIVDDSGDIADRLDEITVGDPSENTTLLRSLNTDLKTICIHLQGAILGDRMLRKPEIDVYVSALDRYEVILKSVRKRDAKLSMQDELRLLNQALSNMHVQLSWQNNLTEDEMHARLDRLRPMVSALHDAWRAPAPSGDAAHSEIILSIFQWADSTNDAQDTAAIFWLYGESRATTTAIAQSVAIRAQNESRLLSSYFFSWTGHDERRDPAHLIPTVMYKIALFDKDFLRRIAELIGTNRDIRDKGASSQIYVLLKKPFKDTIMTCGLPPLIVIDALDACNELEDSRVSQDISSFLLALITGPLSAKLLITSRFGHRIRQILEDHTPLAYHSQALSPGCMEHPFRVEPLLSNMDRDTLRTLKFVPAARYDSLESPSGCLPGTRVDIVNQMLHWCALPTKRFRIYWLAGHAGTGKSTIAKTLCERLVQQGGLLVATFFVSKDSAERRDPLRILHTFAHELAITDIVMQQHIITAIHSHPDIGQRPLTEQVKDLLLSAISNVVGSCQVVLVVDALDECFPILGVEGGNLIRELALVLSDMPVRLVVTSRITPSLQHMFGLLSSEVVRLHEIEAQHVKSDVRLILTVGLQEIAVKHTVTAVWPSEKDLNTLIERTGRFIIFAATLLKFLDTDRFSPQQQLRQVLERTTVPGNTEHFETVDELYLSVLEAASRRNHDSTQVDKELSSRICGLVGTLIVLEEPMSVSALAQLMDAPKDETTSDVRALSAVLLEDYDEDRSGAHLVRIFHPSFRDFLLERCKDPRFSIDVTRQHHSLAVICLRILNQYLKYNMCDIKDPTIPHAEVSNPPLSTRLQQHIPDIVQYACQFWIHHIAKAGPPDLELLSVLRVFVFEHILHWIEVLGLIKETAYAIRCITGVISWAESHRITTIEGVDIRSILGNSQRMLQLYGRLIDKYALQIYYSGQTFMPECALHSAVWKSNNDVVPHLLSARSKQWSSAVFVLENLTDGGPINSVGFSPDGTQIISGSGDNTVRLWDARTWHQTAKLDGHANSVHSVAFSPDGTQIVSGSNDYTVRLWDALTGRETAKLDGHTGSVNSVAFSPDGPQIVSGSGDKTVRLWDALTGRGTAKLDGHTSWVFSVAFSPDGTQIVLGSSDKTVRLWDARTRHETAKSDGHIGPVNSVAFSPDGTQIVSGSGDKTVQLWDALTGRGTAKLDGHTGSVNSIAFSPDGTQIVSGSHDKTVRLWDARTGHETAKFDGHTGSVNSIAFSPDGTQIVSGSDDFTVRLWDARTGYETAKLDGHTGSVKSIAFSPDGTQIVSGSLDNTVRLWDARTGYETAKLDGHTSWVFSVAFSSDGTQIVSGSEDKTVRLWDARTGHQTAKLDGHTDSVNSVAFSPDGTQIVSGSLDKTVRLWDARTGYETAKFKGHASWVYSVAFSPDGTQIVSGSLDNTVRLWDARTGYETAKFDAHSSGVRSVAFSPDDQYVHAHFYWGPSQSWAVSDVMSAPAAASRTHRPSVSQDVKGQVAARASWSLSYDERTNWISVLVAAPAQSRNVRLCWLPAELCGWSHTSRNSVFVIASRFNFQLTIIDFEPMLNMLQNVGLLD